MGLTCFIGVLLVASVAANNLTITEDGEYRHLYVVPTEENTTCPMGEEIPCGSVIDVNGTMLRYERGNLTTIISKGIPSEKCPWMIRAPLGTEILFETTCYHHYHNNHSKEHNVCAHFVSSVSSSRTCGHGYEKVIYSRNNEENFSIYYESGEGFALGFTALITFIGEPTAVTTTMPDLVTSTTSDGVVYKFSFIVMILAFVPHILQMLS